MVLAGVACGATTIDAVWTSAPTTAGDFYSSSWTFTFTLDESFTIENSGYVLGAWWAHAADDYGYTSNTVSEGAIYLTQTDGGLTLNVGRGQVSSTTLNVDTTFKPFNDGSAVDYVYRTGIEKGVTYTITATLKEEGKTGMLTLSDNLNGTWASETGTGATFKGNLAQGGANSTMQSTVNAGITVVPEPTTATLSLLALCGLAARRRRK